MHCCSWFQFQVQKGTWSNRKSSTSAEIRTRNWWAVHIDHIGHAWIDHASAKWWSTNWRAVPSNSSKTTVAIAWTTLLSNKTTFRKYQMKFFGEQFRFTNRSINKQILFTSYIILFVSLIHPHKHKHSRETVEEKPNENHFSFHFRYVRREDPDRWRHIHFAATEKVHIFQQLRICVRKKATE